MHVSLVTAGWVGLHSAASAVLTVVSHSVTCSLQAILAGDFILSAASMALARIGNNTVVSVLSQVIEDLVRGKENLEEQLSW